VEEEFLILDTSTYRYEGFKLNLEPGNYTGTITEWEIFDPKESGRQIGVTFECAETHNIAKRRIWIAHQNEKALKVGRDFLFQVTEALGKVGMSITSKNLTELAGETLQFAVRGTGDMGTRKDGSQFEYTEVKYIAAVDGSLPVLDMPEELVKPEILQTTEITEGDDVPF